MSKRASHHKALTHTHPALGVPIKISLDQIADIDTPNKWIVEPNATCAFLNPAFKLDPKSRTIFTWVALLQMSKSTKKSEKSFAALLKSALSKEMSAAEFEQAVFNTVEERAEKRPKKATPEPVELKE